MHAPPVERRADRSKSACVLAAADMNALLDRNWWGVLGTTVDNRPYAVPVAYGWNGTHIYVASLDGRKIRNLQANPNACLTIMSVESGAAWESVIIEGTVEWVRSPGQLLIAFSALARQCGRPLVPPAPSRLLDARVFRIAPHSMNGRARG